MEVGEDAIDPKDMASITVVDVSGRRFVGVPNMVPVICWVPKGAQVDRLVVHAPDHIESPGEMARRRWFDSTVSSNRIDQMHIIDERMINLLPERLQLIVCLRSVCVKSPYAVEQIIPLLRGISKVLVVFGDEEYKRAVDFMLVERSVTRWGNFGTTGVIQTNQRSPVAPYSDVAYMDVLPADPIIIINASQLRARTQCDTQSYSKILKYIYRVRSMPGIPRLCGANIVDPLLTNSPYPFGQPGNKLIVLNFPGDPMTHAVQNILTTSAGVSFVYPYHCEDKSTVYGRTTSQVDRLIGKPGTGHLLRRLQCRNLVPGDDGESYICTRSDIVRELPCGHVICAGCATTDNHCNVMSCALVQHRATKRIRTNKRPIERKNVHVDSVIKDAIKCNEHLSRRKPKKRRKRAQLKPIPRQPILPRQPDMDAIGDVERRSLYR
jgi:hypothetical protein